MNDQNRPKPSEHNFEVGRMDFKNDNIELTKIISKWSQ